MNIKIRRAVRAEIEWINERYDEVAFVHSNFDNEIIAIAQTEETKVGLGRLVTIDGGSVELGGMYVFDGYRHQGIARKLVDFLLLAADVRHTIYCIPFVKLSSFYQSFGFIPYESQSLVIAPESLYRKFKWCEQFYEEKVELLVRTPKTAM